MLRYRSYSVDFMRNPKVMLQDHGIKSIQDLMDKNAKDEKGRLTSELYQGAFGKVQKGLEAENYFEVICLVQSIMNERLGKLLQIFQGIEDNFKLMTVLEETVSNLLAYMNLHNIGVDPELNDLISENSTGQKGNTRVNRRDISLHEYLSVFTDNTRFTRQIRYEFNRRTAELGDQLAIRTVRVIHRLTD